MTKKWKVWLQGNNCRLEMDLAKWRLGGPWAAGGRDGSGPTPLCAAISKDRAAGRTRVRPVGAENVRLEDIPVSLRHRHNRVQ